MIGGYQIIDLRGIDLEVSESASAITNAQVLKQLLDLRGFIDKAYNFSKPLETQLKPVLIRFRDKKNGEKIEGTTYGELSIVNNYYTFKITGRISGQYTLEINVAFEEVTNAYGNKEWVIDTATIQLIDASNVLEGDIAIDGDLSVTGSINGEEDPSVKPVYYHPIYFYHNDETLGLLFVLSCCILDNNPNKYTRTTLVTKLKELMDGGALINVNGCARTNSANDWSHAIIIVKSSDTYKIEGYTQNNYGQILDITDIEEFTEVQDGVNKIN